MVAPSKLLAGLVVCGLLLITVLPASSEQIESTSATIWIPRLATLAISGDISGLLTLTQDGDGETSFDQGYVESAANATILTLNGNDPWDLSAKLAGSWSCPGTYDKDENDLYIRITNTPTGTIQSGADSYINLSGTDTMILSDDAGAVSNDVDIQTKVLLDWTKDIPGSYSITITYTLVVHHP